jgi:PAS domain S-box-containing protein
MHKNAIKLILFISLGFVFIIKALITINIIEYTQILGTLEYILFTIIFISYFNMCRNIRKLENTELKEVLVKKEKEVVSILSAINMSSAVIEFCPTGNIITANSTFLKIFDYSLAEIKGKHHNIFINKRDSASKKYINFWNDLQVGKFKSGEFLRFDKSGNRVWIHGTYNPILDETGKPYKIMKIVNDISELIGQKEELSKKNAYLEHAAKILRHDMHSGINIYIPRGISSLKRRLSNDVIKELNLYAPLKMLSEGLAHTQTVYNGVFEFTNLVKSDAVLNKELCDPRKILKEYLSKTSYGKQVIIKELIGLELNKSLFCTAIDNLIRNGLKYNDSKSKIIKIYMEKDNTVIVIQDNGRGMTQLDFEYLSQPYTRKKGQVERGTGLGLNICVAILNEHGFNISCEKNKIGTKIKVLLK